MNWMPEGKKAAVVFTIDDVHPAKSSDYYEAGGDLDKGALGNLEWLLQRHSQLKATLFTTADWREISPLPTRKILASIPYLREHFYLARIWKKGTMRLDRHPKFVDYIKNLPRTNIAPHGLHHVHKGLNIAMEFQNQNYDGYLNILQQIIDIFINAKIAFSPGICPPAWNTPLPLQKALIAKKMLYIESARDLFTPITKEAVTNMTGIKNHPLVYPRYKNGLIHFATNFQATCEIDRALAVINQGGLLAIKAHIIKSAMGYISLDGLDKVYRNYLDMIFTVLNNKYGDSLWWTTMDEIARYIKKGAKENENGSIHQSNKYY